ncbi:MAG: AsmA family protein [Gammaproteobacteria bacterium]|nr:AsmA family protein [Gammaproteobacteria bacterium]
MLAKVTKGLTGLLIFIFLWPFILSLFVNEDKVKAVISRQIESVTHRQLTIAGDLWFENFFSNLLYPSVYAEQISLSNGDAGRAPNVFYAERISAEFSLWPFLRGEVELRSMELHGAQIWVETDENGESNLIFNPHSQDKTVIAKDSASNTIEMDGVSRFSSDSPISSSIGNNSATTGPKLNSISSSVYSKVRSNPIAPWLSILGFQLTESVVHFSHGKKNSRSLFIDSMEMESVDIREGWQVVPDGSSAMSSLSPGFSDEEKSANDLNEAIEITFSARWEQTEIRGNMQLDSLPFILTQRGTNVALDARVADASVLATGRIDDIFAWQGVTLFSSLSIPQPEVFSNWLGRDLSSIPPINAKWEWRQPRGLDSARAERIRINASEFGIDAVIHGRINRLFDTEGVMLSATVNGTLDKGTLPEALHDAMIDVNFNGDVLSKDDDFFLKINQGTMISRNSSQKNVQLSLGETDKWLLLDASLTHEVSLRVDSLPLLGEVVDVGLPDIGKMKATGVLGIDGETVFISDFHLRNESGDVVVDLQGRLNYVKGNPEGRVSLKANVQSQTVLEQLFAGEEHGISRLQMTGDLFAGSSRLWGESLRITGSNDTTSITLSGSASELLPKIVTELDLVAENTDLNDLPFPGTLSPTKQGDLALTAKLIATGDGDFDISGINGQIKSPGLSLNFAGGVRQVIESADARLQFDWKMSSPDVLVQSMGENVSWLDDLSLFFPLTGNFLLSHREQRDQSGPLENDVSGWKVENVKVENLSGDIKLLAEGEGFSLSPLKGELILSAEGIVSDPILSFLEKQGLLMEFNHLFSEVLVDGQVVGSGRLFIDDASISLADMNLGIRTAESQVDVSGDITSFNPFIPGEVKAAFSAHNIGSVIADDIAIFRRNNQVEGEVRMSQVDNLNVLDVDLAVGESDLKGLVTWPLVKLKHGLEITPESGSSATSLEDGINVEEFGGFYAKFTSNKLDTESILAGDEDKDKDENVLSEEDNGSQSTSYDGDQRVLSKVVFPTEWLEGFKGRLDWDIQELTTGAFKLKQARINAEAGSGALVLSARGSSKKGPLNLDLELKNGVVPEVTLSLMGMDVDESSIALFDELDIIESGAFSMEMSLNGRGYSVAEIASTANGSIKFLVDDARISNAGLNLLGGDWVSQFLLTINPFREKETHTGVECGVGHFLVEDGVLNGKSGLALKTDKITFIGGGTIDLSDENIRILIAPKARKGFGISTSSIAKMIRVGGNLSEPKVEVDPAGILKTGVALGAAIASSGLSLVAQGLVDRIRANLDVCEIALNDPHRVAKIKKPPLPFESQTRRRK